MSSSSAACAACREGKQGGHQSAASSIPGIDTTPNIWIHHLTLAVRTGDIVLFSSKHATSNITKFFTNSIWDHVGVVVKPTPKRAYLVEWGGGLFASELTERLMEYDEFDAREIRVRHLKLGAAHRDQLEDQMEDFLDMLFREQLGSNGSVPLGQVARAARRQVFSAPDLKTNEAPFIDDLTTLFCSKLVAVAYKSIGVLSVCRDASTFLPKHFAEGHAKFLSLQNGTELSPASRVTFEPELLRSAVGAIMHPFASTADLLNGAVTGVGAHPQPLPGIYSQLLGPVGQAISDGFDFASGAAKEREAATRLQQAVRRLLAKRELQRRRAGTSTSGAPLRRHQPTGWENSQPRATGVERRARLEGMNAAKAPRAEGLLLDEHGERAASMPAPNANHLESVAAPDFP